MADEQQITFAEYAVKSGQRPEFVHGFMVKFGIGPDFMSTQAKFSDAMNQWLNAPVSQEFNQ